MKKIYEGGTGSGKTYNAINDAKNIGNFAYLAPCRQLVYESWSRYANKEVDQLSTGEIKINKQKDNNLFCVYETKLDAQNYQTLIIDEAHYLTDLDRSSSIQEKISEFKDANKNIFLLTATRNFRKPRDFQIIKLKAISKFKKTRISFNDAFYRAGQGVSTIIFHKYADNCGIYGGYPITASTMPYERIKAQLDFTSGKINLIETTNVLAQGLNFPAENIIILDNHWDTSEIVKQKLGRLGRYGITNKKSTLTYCLSRDTLKIPKVKIPKSKKKKRVSSITSYLLENANKLDYADHKYDFPVIIKKLSKDFEYDPDSDISKYKTSVYKAKKLLSTK